VETVTVSSSRITTAGFNAPTPTTVLDLNYIQNQNKDNIYNAVAQLPSLLGSTGQQSCTDCTSGGQNGLFAFNLFGLGRIRTLTLLDGQRFVGANLTGIPDISEFPQLLIQRVDVVTGGASASWGSDAMAGVVNFVTDKKFVGFKANISSGLSTYGDNATVTFQMAAGTAFAGGRGHVEVAGEFSHLDGVQGGWQRLTCCAGKAYDALGGSRPWFKAPTILQYSDPASTPKGQPQYFATVNGQETSVGRYGLINNGPLQGIAFAEGGTPYRFNYGTGVAGVNPLTGLGGIQQGIPAGDGSVTNCLQDFCVGGETSNQFSSAQTIAVPMTRGNVYGRLSWDLTPHTEIFITMNWAQVQTSNIPNPNSWLSSLDGISGGGGQDNNGALAMTSPVFSNSANNLGQLLQPSDIQCGNAPGGPNAYLPASIQAACLSNGINSFGLGSLFQGLGPQVAHSLRDNRRLVGGANGTFNLFNTDWSWNGYYEHGETDTRITVRGITLKPYLFAAIDSVQVTAANQATYSALNVPVGAIVCRSAVADAEGCVPFNPFGGPISEASKAWVYGGQNWGPGPLQLNHQMQDAADFSFSGTPFSDWAGPISVAAGAAWRQEAWDVRGDGAGNGTVAGTNGASGSPCVDPLLNCVNGKNWYAGNFHNGQGNYHVTEGFVELGIPLINTPDWGNANLNIAGRHARYSTAGDSNTWKAGLTWETPVDGVRLRAMQSRDVRAPNLGELFAPATTSNGSAPDPWAKTSVQVILAQLGNTQLKPERSINTQLGVVYQPSWLPGFQASLDYYRVYVAGEINTIDRATSVNNCFAGLTQYCAAIITTPGTTYSSIPPRWLQVNSQYYNVASTVTDGFNFETSYQFNLQDWNVVSVPGDFVFRLLGTYVSKFITNPGIQGGFITDSAGENSGDIPHLKVLATEEYSNDKWSLTLTERWISQGKLNNSYVVCNPGSCPASTLAHPTINMNSVPSIFYMDLGASYNLNDHWKLYMQVDNAFNKSPPPIYVNDFTSYGVNSSLYDLIGRTFHVGVRIND